MLKVKPPQIINPQLKFKKEMFAKY